MFSDATWGARSLGRRATSKGKKFMPCALCRMQHSAHANKTNLDKTHRRTSVFIILRELCQHHLQAHRGLACRRPHRSITMPHILEQLWGAWGRLTASIGQMNNQNINVRAVCSVITRERRTAFHSEGVAHERGILRRPSRCAWQENDATIRERMIQI